MGLFRAISNAIGVADDLLIAARAATKQLSELAPKELLALSEIRELELEKQFSSIAKERGLGDPSYLTVLKYRTLQNRKLEEELAALEEQLSSSSKTKKKSKP